MRRFVGLNDFPSSFRDYLRSYFREMYDSIVKLLTKWAQNGHFHDYIPLTIENTSIIGKQFCLK